MIRFQGAQPVPLLETKPTGTTAPSTPQPTALVEKQAVFYPPSLPPVLDEKPEKRLAKVLGKVFRPIRKLLPHWFRPLEVEEKQLIRLMDSLHDSVVAGKASFKKLDPRTGSDFGPDQLEIDGKSYELRAAEDVDPWGFHQNYVLINPESRCEVRICQDFMLGSAGYSSPTEQIEIGSAKVAVRKAGKRLIKALLRLRQKKIVETTEAFKLKMTQLEKLTF